MDRDIRIENIMNDIKVNQLLLNQTDYKAIKHSEGLISEEEYAETKAMRQQYRDKINRLEEEIASLTNE